MSFPDDKYDQGADAWGDHYYMDSQGREYNENNQETYWSKRHQNILAQNEARQQQIRLDQMRAEHDASVARERKMWQDAWNKAGGFPFLSGSRGGGTLRSLFPPLSNFEKFIIKAVAAFMLGYVGVYTVYYTVVDPALKTINKGVSKVKGFFNSVWAGIKNFFTFLWTHFTWIFTVWTDRLSMMRWKPENITVGRDLLMDIVSVGMIVFTVIYLTDYYLKGKKWQRIPQIVPADIWKPAAALLALSLIWWLLIRRFYVWTLFDAVYDTFCMTLWVVAAEWLINRYIIKKK